VAMMQAVMLHLGHNLAARNAMLIKEMMPPELCLILIRLSHLCGLIDPSVNLGPLSGKSVYLDSDPTLRLMWVHRSISESDKWMHLFWQLSFDVTIVSVVEVKSKLVH
jgi:hypothetical protein